MRALALGLGMLAAAVCARPASAVEETPERAITTGEIESWLDAEPGATPADQGDAPGAEEPLPAPRHHGLVLESGLGFVTQLGSMKHITPTAPEFQVRLGYEFLTWLMPFLEANVSFASTAYAPQPPPQRSYYHYGVGAGLRVTVPVGRVLAVLAQGSLGAARVSEQNVLSVYGFPDADEPNLYLDAELGLEWYQVNPHLALAVHGGVRHYGPGLTRDRGGEAPIAGVGNASLRYAF
jgi:hypothetical protein